MAKRVRVPRLTAAGVCERLERMVDMMEVSRERTVAPLGAEPYYARLIRQAREGDCQVSHSCAARGRCPMGVQTWRPHGITRPFIAEMKVNGPCSEILPKCTYGKIK